MTTSQTNSSRDHVDVGALITTIENFNRFYIRLPALQKLSFTTLSVLDTLTSRGPTRLTELARTEQISQPGITQLVTRLEQDGLVERRPDPTDGRATLVHITEAGRQVGTSRLEDRTRRLLPLVARLTPEEQQAITAALPALSRLAELGNRARP
ncbi:MarR family winged helix-turn-helix transcriptional regulator [Streptomyces sparsogenes]|uniref:MarR family winged helix-turn-helix transcriptional regulator n=1 Tax=Streptomyces sparsogenes TaxID=67365 RepID=UPI003403B138